MILPANLFLVWVRWRLDGDRTGSRGLAPQRQGGAPLLALRPSCAARRKLGMRNKPGEDSSHRPREGFIHVRQASSLLVSEGKCARHCAHTHGKLYTIDSIFGHLHLIS